MKKILWWLIAGTRGGKTRAKVIEALEQTPSNANQLTEQLKLDYKTVRHHLNVLLDNKVIVSEGDRYGVVYFLSDEMESNYETFKDIWRKVKTQDRKEK